MFPAMLHFSFAFCFFGIFLEQCSLNFVTGNFLNHEKFLDIKKKKLKQKILPINKRKKFKCIYYFI